MDDMEIRHLLEKAIEKVLKEDYWLIIHDLSEQSISHKLAEYLQPEFNGYHVDCEYNGNIEREGNRKRISVLKEKLINLGLLREKEEIDIEKEYTSRAVFPDIIIHERGTNKNNLCIVEVKKSTSKVPFEYDRLKLEAYTSTYYDNDLRYQLGVFIEFVTGQREPKYKIQYCKGGQMESNPLHN